MLRNFVFRNAKKIATIWSLLCIASNMIILSVANSRSPFCIDLNPMSPIDISWTSLKMHLPYTLFQSPTTIYNNSIFMIGGNTPSPGGTIVWSIDIDYLTSNVSNNVS